MEVDTTYVSHLREIKDVLDYLFAKKMAEWKPSCTSMDTLALARYVLAIQDFAKTHPEWSRRLRFLCDAEVVHSALLVHHSVH